ncbi:MAG TPA: hypothetical protein VNN18_12295 [Candidatus Xenobia bacterium]|nr:hypothetical protein [Candidatus Xenobia bacterium]
MRSKQIVRFCLLSVSLGVVCFIAVAQAPVPRQVLLTSTRSLPTEVKYERGYYILFHRAHTRTPGPADHSVTVLDNNGAQLFFRNPGFDIPEARMVRVRDATITKNGLLVVAGFAWNSLTPGPGAAALLVVYDLSNGQPQRIIRTNPIGCNKVVADDNANFWCLGLDVEKRDSLKRDYELIYKLSLTGEVLARFLLRSEFAVPKTAEPFESSPNGNPQLLLSPSGGVLAWFPNADTLVELDATGNVTARARVLGRLPSREHWRLITVGIVPDGTILGFLPASAGEPLPGDPPAGVYRLNRTTGSWELLSTEWADSYPPNRLIGVDGRSGVVWVREENRLVWLPPSN